MNSYEWLVFAILSFLAAGWCALMAAHVGVFAWACWKVFREDDHDD